jgi:hypothetical protein
VVLTVVLLAASLAVLRRMKKESCWPVKKLEGGGAPVEAIAAEEAAGGVSGAAEVLPLALC